MFTFTFLWGGGGFPEYSHRVSLVQLLLYDNLCAMKIKDVVYKVQDHIFVFLFLFYDNAVLPVYVRVDILLTSWKYSQDRIISLRWAGWAYRSSLALKLFIEAPVLSKESEWSCICVLDFGVVPTVWYFLFFIFFPFIH